MDKDTLQLIFQKYLDNNCSPEELDLLLEAMNGEADNDTGRQLIRQQLMRHLDEQYINSPEEQALLDRQFLLIINRINAAPSPGMHDGSDTDAAINLLTNPAPGPRIHWKRWVAAASILLALGAGQYLWQKQVPVKPLAATVQDIAPGTSGAILTLADGKQLQLDSMRNGVVATQGRTQVLLQQGAISYSGTPANTTSITWNSIHTPRARQFKLTLPDGSQVWLNAASSVRYPTAFMQEAREVEVTGEVYFEVAPQGTQPFRVKFPKGNVEVLGTHFNINTYADEPVIKTTLLEGRIKVNSLTSVVLKQGQQAQIDEQGTLKTITGINTDEEMAWMNGKIAMSNASLDAILRQISRWYNVDIRIESKLPTTKFNGIINRNVNLSSMLGVLEEYGIHCKLQGNVLVIL